MRRLAVVTSMLLVVALSRAPGAAAQDTETLGGAALGGASGAVLGLVGSAALCNRTLAGATCPRIGASVGVVIGATSGAILGARDPDALHARSRAAAYGVLAGGTVGYALMRIVRPYRWPDVAAFAAVGGAVAASGTGAAIGFGAGAAVGSLAWWLLPDMQIGDAITFSIYGLTLGGLIGWGAGAAGSDRDDGVTLVPLQFRF